jgi:Holliday junction resolvase RusA-like endonuclease
MIVTFVVPGQPQGKGRARVGRIAGHARMFTPEKTLAYEGLVAHQASIAMGRFPLFEGPCSVSMDIVCQIPASWSVKKQTQAIVGAIRPITKPDVDNVEKAIFDGCNGVVWKDDVQVVDVRKSKRYGETPGVTVVIAYATPGIALAQQEEIAA